MEFDMEVDYINLMKYLEIGTEHINGIKHDGLQIVYRIILERVTDHLV